MQIPGLSQIHQAWKSAFQTRVPLYFCEICISLAFWKNFKKQTMSLAFGSTPTGLGKFRTKVSDTECQENALRMSFVEMIDSKLPPGVPTCRVQV